MYCINCGATVDEDSTFCTNCGKRIKADPVAAAEEAPVSETAVSESAVTAEPAPTPSVPSYQTSYSASWNEQTVQPVVPEKESPEKVFFGKGALAFCLVVIGLLAISTGVFAGLYFSVI